MLRRGFFKRMGLLGVSPALLARAAAARAPEKQAGDDRAYWVATLTQIAAPVLENLAAGTLRATMPVEHKPGTDRDRADVTHLEAFGRTMAGLAPWIELPADATDEGRLRARYRQLSQAALAHAVDPASPDYMNWTEGGQPLVDAAFLAHAVLRAPQALWHELDGRTQQQLVDALTATRVIRPAYNNWLLFSAMVEAALLRVGAPWDVFRLDVALRKMGEWYVGDGHYADGPDFHWDYYNSYVIQPFLLDLLALVRGREARYEEMYARQLQIARRYGEIQERLICPDGSFPPIGRSITYRFGAFQLLAQLALQQVLPPTLPPAQVRSALTAVVRKVMAADDTFGEGGWLRLGLYGSQPDLAESYISTGSLYLCTVAFLPLGLPPADPFWSGPAMPWTSQRVWRGESLPADHALSL